MKVSVVARIFATHDVVRSVSQVGGLKILGAKRA